MNTNTNIKRQKLRVLLKMLALVALLLLLIVFFKSLFPASNKLEENRKYELLEVDLEGIKTGEIRKVRFAGKDVAILKRKYVKFKGIATENESQQLPDISLNKNSRSQLPDFFVYFNTGDSGNCPLFYDGKGFKDICSQKRFDNTGREVGKELQGFSIKIPPHYFNLEDGVVNELVFGRWEK